MAKAEKCANLLEQIRLCIEKSHYRFSFHALERKQERALHLFDIFDILKRDVTKKVKMLGMSSIKCGNML